MSSLFSTRNKYVEAPPAMLPESMTIGLRNKLWNAVDSVMNNNNIKKISFELWHYLYKEPLDTRGEYGGYEGTVWEPTFRSIRERFFKAPWFGVYDHIELLARLKVLSNDVVNTVLAEELAAYRLVDGNIVQIADEQEIKEIEAAANDTDKFSAASRHIRDSLELLAQRPNPNFRNSIKESISAVEAVAKVINGSSSDTLGEALKKMRKQRLTDPALLQGFEKLYGWTSDKEGIRHSLMDLPTLGIAEAKFFIVACSSFANYLKSLD